MGKKSNLEKKVLNWVAGGLASISSLINSANAQSYDFSMDCFVDPNTVTPIAVGTQSIQTSSSSSNPDEVGRDHYYWFWLTVPRQPAISEDWVAYIQDQPLETDPNDARFRGDAHLIHRPTDTYLKITDSRGVGGLDLYDNHLVCSNKVNVAADPNDNFQIFLYDLNTINLDTINPTTLMPDFVDTLQITESDKDCIWPEINKDKIIWVRGKYNLETHGKNSWTEVWAYSIMEEMSFPITQSEGNKWHPSISGDWVAYGKISPEEPVTGRSWNVEGYNFFTGNTFEIYTNNEKFCRSVKVHYDSESNQAIVAAEIDSISMQGDNARIGITRLKRDLEEIIINPPENPHNLPTEFEIDAKDIESIDMHGRPGHGPVLVYAHYNTPYANTVDTKGINVRTGIKFDVFSGGWNYSPRVWMQEDGESVVIARNDSYSEPLQEPINLLETLTESLDIEPPKFAALISAPLNDRPIPINCGDSGTYYLDADFNRDCYVDLTDIQAMATYWLESYCGAENIGLNSCGCDGTDLNKDHKVNSKDYRLVVNELGKSTDPQNPEFIPIDPPIPTTELIVTTDVREYFNYEDDHSYYDFEPDPNKVIPYPKLPKNIYTIKIEDRTFGLDNINEVKIPTKGIEELVYNYEFYPYLEYENNLSTKWIKSEEGDYTVFRTTNPEDNLNAGYTLVFPLLSSSRGAETKDMILSNETNTYTFPVNVPLEQTLGAYDVNKDGIVDIWDLERMADYWLADLTQPSTESGDFNYDGFVNLKDSSKLAENWLKTESWY